MRTSTTVLAGAASLALLAGGVTIAVAEDTEEAAPNPYLAGEITGLMTTDYSNPLGCAPWVLPDGTELPTPTLSHVLVGETTSLGPTVLEARNCMTFSAPLEDVTAGTFVMSGDVGAGLTGTWSGDCAPGLVGVGEEYRCTGLFEVTGGTGVLTGASGWFRALADFSNTGFTEDGLLRDTPTRWFLEGVLELETAMGTWTQVANDTPNWADDNGWADPTNYETMRLVAVNDDLYLLAREHNGIDTWRFDTEAGTWAQIGDNMPGWSDETGWEGVMYHDTMRLVPADDDLYLLARTAFGVDTWRFDTVMGDWSQVADDTPYWADENGWADPTNYETMRVAVTDDALYLLARSGSGVDTWRLDRETDQWSQVADDTPYWADDKGWDKAPYYDTMRAAVLGDDIYLLARSSQGVDTWRLDTEFHQWTQVSDDHPKLSDGGAWNDESNYATMRTIATDDALYLLARSNNGIETFRFEPESESWSHLGAGTPAWSDASGFDDVANYDTMRLEVLDEDLYLLARTDDGVDTWRFDTAADQWLQVTDGTPAWSDAHGWDDVANYDTIQTAVAGDGLYLLARSDDGVDTWRFGLPAAEEAPAEEAPAE